MATVHGKRSTIFALNGSETASESYRLTRLQHPKHQKNSNGCCRLARITEIGLYIYIYSKINILYLLTYYTYPLKHTTYTPSATLQHPFWGFKKDTCTPPP